ncbi:MAG: phosphoribosylanthranilate isomerase [Bacteroidales bacterium]|nr:phosphoribosylanthranilate isomerase [Bacteroidales bacterium]MCM1415767.1 phosphoribosylanthranilate isomerase [bacterium]MCM1424305.1 phosphoribosylanthranilate isomerase [bacterium]
MKRDEKSKIKIKLCGLTRPSDIETANLLHPDYVGFVFAKKSRRYVSPDRVKALKEVLRPEIMAVGVFVNEEPEVVADWLAAGIIDVAQLHGTEDETYIEKLRELTDRPLIKAFSITGVRDIREANASTADFVLLDTGEGGTGKAFDRELLAGMERPYFLAGGLDPSNVGEAVRRWRPYGVDVSSGIETDGLKDSEKMRAFVTNVRKTCEKNF